MSTFDAKVLVDSVAPHGVRLTTFEVTMPRFILAEFNTHRMFSRNAASSRAIPVDKRIRVVLDSPFIPEFGRNKRGMQSEEEFLEGDQSLGETLWLHARDVCAQTCRDLSELGAHKQWANRLIEPFAWVTDIVSMTDLPNFFYQRRSKLAQPEFRRVADLMWDSYSRSVPCPMEYDNDWHWHLPLFDHDTRADVLSKVTFEDETGDETLREVRQRVLSCQISAARCARVSYLTHDGRRDIDEDLRLFNDLIKNGHWSPLEHVAKPVPPAHRSLSYRLDQLLVVGKSITPKYGEVGYCGNFKGWQQLRKTYENENVTKYVPETTSPV